MNDAKDDHAPEITWDIRREGRSWKGEEFRARADHLMELNFEISGGKLFWSEETRRMVLAMLLENVGMDAAVRLGDPERWREAIDAASRSK